MFKKNDGEYWQDPEQGYKSKSKPAKAEKMPDAGDDYYTDPEQGYSSRHSEHR